MWKARKAVARVPNDAVVEVLDGLAEAVRRNLSGLLKTGTYGAMHLTVAVAVAYAVSGSWTIALGIGLIEPLVQTFFYDLHERLWRRARPTAPQGSPA